MIDWHIYIALIIVLAMVFWQGVRYGKSRIQDVTGSLDKQYFLGLNFLLNEQPDAAIDAFIKALEVNSETLETHLALGKLLRRRGEVDRAIKIHQNLLARPGLSLEQSQQAEYELATDFAKAGLLDRAEGLLKTLIAQDGAFKVSGMQRLLEVYRDEKDWEQGLDILHALAGSRFSKSYEKWAPVRAHFCCELAEQSMPLNDYQATRRWLKQALSYDRRSVRASLLLGHLEILAGNIQTGIQYLQKIAEQNPDYIAEAFPLLAEGYARLGAIKKYYKFLVDMNQRFTLPAVQIALTDVIARLDGDKAAAEFIAAEVQKNPTGEGLHKLLHYYLSFTNGQTREHLLALQAVMLRVISHSPQYQCECCGFKGQELHWLCPGCKTWGSVKPKIEAGVGGSIS